MNKPTALPVYMSTREYTWGIRYTLFQLFILPTLLALVWILVMPDDTDAALSFTFYLLNFAVLVPLLHNYLRQSVDHLTRNVLKVLLTAVVGFGVYYVSTTALSVLFKHLMPQFFNVNDNSITASAQDDFLLVAMGTVVFVPTAEELMYRGLVYGLCRKHSRVLAFAVSAALFASIHVVGYISGDYSSMHLLLCFVQYIPAGLVLAGAYEYTGNIFAPILIHAVINLIGILSMR